MLTPDQKGWTYQVFPRDLPSTEFGPFAPLVSLWRDKAGAARHPSWQDFDIADFKGWWGCLSLANLMSDPLDLEFVLWGTKLTEWWGIDYTRKKMSTAYERREENWRTYEKPYFQSLLEHDGIGLISGDLRVIDRRFVSVQGIDLLLSKNGAVTQVLSGYRELALNKPVIPNASPLRRL